jgi:hypothetical protein
MPELWMPHAVKTDLGDHAPCDPAFPAKAIAHITADVKTTAEHPKDLLPFSRLKSYFTHDGKGLAPHILWDPFTGAFAQFFPADSRSKGLLDAVGGTRTNRTGKVVLQIEALFFPHCTVDGKVYTRLIDTPCKGWTELNAWVRSWQVPDVWPRGRPTSFTADRSTSVWTSGSGWFAHAHVPENDHVDPGSWLAFDTVPPAPVPGQPPAAGQEFEPFPGVAFFHTGRTSPIVAAMHHRLVAEGCDRYTSSTGIDTWGPGDVRSYAAWQERLGHTGGDANGIPGESSWDALHVPSV